MYNKELELFQRNNESIWTDEHIRKSLLKAHLDENNDGASRKRDKRCKIIKWINDNINKNSSIIDLGCGPGLYSYELGFLGYDVLGVDFNIDSIRYAIENNGILNKVNYKHCDYLKDDIEGKYNVAIMIWCDFGALIPNEQKTLLKKLYNLLKEDGVFIFDVFQKGSTEINDRKNWKISNGNDFWSKDPYILLEEIKLFNEGKVVGERNYIIDQKNGKIKEFILWDQYYDEIEIRTLLEENGFETIEINKNMFEDEEIFLIKSKKKIP